MVFLHETTHFYIRQSLKDQGSTIYKLPNSRVKASLNNLSLNMNESHDETSKLWITYKGHCDLLNPKFYTLKLSILEARIKDSWYAFNGQFDLSYLYNEI